MHSNVTHLHDCMHSYTNAEPHVHVHPHFPTNTWLIVTSASAVWFLFFGGFFYQFPQVLCFIVPPAAALGMFPLHARNQSVGFPAFPEPPPLLPITISSGRSGMILLCVRLQTPFMITAPQVKTSRTTCSRANLTQRLPFKLFVTFWGGEERHCKHYNLIS